MKHLYLIALILLILPLYPSSAQPPEEISYHDHTEMPGGKVGERIKSILSTVNSNDSGQFARFMNEECTRKFLEMAPMDRHIQIWRRVYLDTGGLDFYSIRTYVPARDGQTVVILKDRNYDSWQGLVIMFEDDTDYLVDGLRFTPARPPADRQEKDLTEAQFIRELNSLLDRVIEKNVFSGTVLVARGEDVLVTRAGGEASKRFHVPNNIDTKFNLGSMNKMFTATAVCQLAEQGKLAFDDPISRYVDETWLPEEITDKITVHHLLTHTSGLGSYFNDTYAKTSRMQFRAVNDYKPLVNGDTLQFEPGSSWRYSNTGMLLLGVVIESATGGDYFDYIRDHIYKPAGMADSDCYEMDYPVENLAIGYSPAPGSPWGWQNNYYKHVIKGGPAGGGFSTVGDLHRYALALLNGKLVSESSLELLWKDHFGEGYGYGFGIDDGPLGKVVGHSGGFDGINSNLDIMVDTGYIVAVMSNIDLGASPLAQKIKEMLARVK